MNNVLAYKGYYGTIEYSEADDILFGEVIGINSLLSYEGSDPESLRKDFELTIDDYIEFCAENNFEPEQNCHEGLYITLEPELHKQVVVLSTSRGQSLNSTVEEAIRQYVGAVR